MNNKGDNSPSMDYYELRRRHEEFKKRQAQNAAPTQRPAARPAPKPARPTPAAEEAPVDPTPAIETPASPVEPSVEESAAVDTPVVNDFVEPEFIDSHAEGVDDEDLDEDNFSDDEEELQDNPNPFDSFISLFHGVKDKLGRKRAERESEPDEDDAFDLPSAEETPKKHLSLFRRRKKNEDEYLDYDDSDYADENYVKEAFPEDAPYETALEDEPPTETSSAAEPVEGLDGEDPEAPSDIVEDFDEEAVEDDLTDGDFDEEDFDDEAPDEDDLVDDEAEPRKHASAFKRFLNLLVVREDDEPAEDDWEDEDDEDSWDDEDDEGFSSGPSTDVEEDEDDLSYGSGPVQSLYEDADDFEGGSDMDENNKLNIEMTEQMAASLESKGMSRRERRELAERLAAEEAAKRAAAEAAAKPVEPIAAEEPLVVDSVNDVSAGIVDIQEPAASVEPFVPVAPVFAEEAPAEDEKSSISFVDEPTREFKPLSKKSSDSSAGDIFSFDGEDVEEEDDEEDEEIEEKPRRFSFFGKKNRHAEPDDDEEDEEPDDEDEDDEEDEEPEEKKPRRGLFARKSRSKYEEDEDEEGDEEDDDEDDYDEYDEYDDEYDEDEEDEDYDDYDDEDSSFGRPIIGFFKWLFGFILLILVIVFALNFLDYFNVFSLDSVFERYYNKAPGVFDTLFPSHNLKRLTAPEETITAIDPLDDVEATAAPEITEAPTVTNAPVVSEAPEATSEAPVATEAPTATEAPASDTASVG